MGHIVTVLEEQIDPFFITWPPAKMTGEPEGLGLYGMVTPFGGDYDETEKYELLTVTQITAAVITHF